MAVCSFQAAIFTPPMRNLDSTVQVSGSKGDNAKGSAGAVHSSVSPARRSPAGSALGPAPTDTVSDSNPAQQQQSVGRDEQPSAKPGLTTALSGSSQTSSEIDDILGEVMWSPLPSRRDRAPRPDCARAAASVCTRTAAGASPPLAAGRPSTQKGVASTGLESSMITGLDHVQHLII